MVDDINNLSFNDLPDDLDLLTASFPCIDLSLAGNRRGLAGQHSGTIWPFLDLTADIVGNGTPPKALLLENVTGFVTSHSGSDLEQVCERIGYLLDLIVVDAKWFTPQSRPRLFVVALLTGLLRERSTGSGCDQSLSGLAQRSSLCRIPAGTPNRRPIVWFTFWSASPPTTNLGGRKRKSERSRMRCTIACLSHW